MSDNQNVTAASLLSVTSSIGVFTSLLPPFSDVRKSVGDPDMREDVRLGELAAGTLVMAIGIIGASLTGSHLPFVVSLVSVLGLVFMYETALAATNKKGSK